MKKKKSSQVEKLAEWQPKRKMTKHDWAKCSVHVFISLKTGHCADNWSPKDCRLAIKMLKAMGYPMGIPDANTPERFDIVGKMFRNARKAGVCPPVVNPNMARAGKDDD